MAVTPLLNQFNIPIPNIYQVMQQFDTINVYTAASQVGPFTPKIGSIPLSIDTTTYWYTDLTPLATPAWYQYTYYNSKSTLESAPLATFEGGTTPNPVGYTFETYSAPPGEWGEIVTVDDMRYTYLWGIDTVAQNTQRTEFEDSQLKFYVDAALKDFEKFLTIDIRKRVYLTQPELYVTRQLGPSIPVQSPFWREGVGYTDEEDSYQFDPGQWLNYGFIQLRHAPIISVERAWLLSPVETITIDLVNQNWIRVYKNRGQINLFPTKGLGYGPFAIGALPWRMLGVRYPGGFEFDYTTGWKTADFVPSDLREVIAKWACIKLLGSIADGLLAGFSSRSLSLDSLSESFSSTQSPDNTYFGARTKQYAREVDDWLSRNRYKYARIPMSFVGGM